MWTRGIDYGIIWLRRLFASHSFATQDRFLRTSVQSVDKGSLRYRKYVYLCQQHSYKIHPFVINYNSRNDLWSILLLDRACILNNTPLEEILCSALQFIAVHTDRNILDSISWKKTLNSFSLYNRLKTGRGTSCGFKFSYSTRQWNMSASNSPTVHKFNPQNHPVLPESYRHVSEVPISTTTKLVSFAGQVGMTDPNNPSPRLGDQVRIALENVDICLAAAGVTKSEIISVRQYLVKFTSMSEEDQKARTDTYGNWWRKTEGDNPPPPLTLIGVDCLYKDECLFEMEVTCVGKL